MKITDVLAESSQLVDENLRDWFKEKWVRFGPDGKIRGDCARGDDSEGKPKCLPQSKAHSLGKKGRASAAARKRREDPDPERSGKAINVNTKKKSNEGLSEARNSLFAFVKQQFPTWPDYVLKDFLYQQAKGIRDQAELDDFLKRNKQDFGNCKWTLTKLPITFDIFTPKTQRMLASREGGSSNPFQVPRDAERHAQQSQMIQQKGVSAEPIIVAKLANGYDLIEGWHRTIQHLKAFPQGYTGPAWVCTGATYKSESVKQDVAEQELDEACWKGYHKEGNKELFGKTYPNCVKNEGVAEGVNDYLWHGSKSEHKILYPQQANDTGGKEESNKNAVYATPIAKVAIAMGLTTPGSDTGMFPNDPQMVLFSGNIRKGQMVYLHKVPKDLFIKHNSREWYSKPGVEAVKPIEVVKVPVDQWLHLIRQATPADWELRKQNMKEGAAKGSLNELAPSPKFGKDDDDDKYTPPDFGKPFKAKYLGQNKFQVFCRRPQDPSNVITLNAEVQKYGLEWDDENVRADGTSRWFLDSPGAVYLSWKYGEIPLPKAIDQARNPGHIHDLVTDYLTYAHGFEIQKVAEYFGFTPDGEMNESMKGGFLKEFAPPGSDGGGENERSRRLRKLLEIAIKVAKEKNVDELGMIHAMNMIAGDDFFNTAVEGLLPDITDQEYMFVLQTAYKTVKQGLAEGSLNEFAISGGDDGDDPLDNYPCYDCGSTIFLHHTKLCDLAEPNAIHDLPAKPGSQHWTGEIPKGLHPIPGLGEGVAEGHHSETCPHCGGEMVSEELMNEKKDACYYKVKSRYKVWPSAYASGALVKCRKKGASNWGNGGKSNESVSEAGTRNADKIRRIQHMLNKKFNANLDIDGVLGPLTLQSIKKFLPAKSSGPAPHPDRTTAVQGNKIKSEDQNMKFKDITHGVEESAPPGAKAERMVKHIKKGYAKDGKLSDKEKSIAYATAWKAHNKGVTESSQRVDSLVTDALKIMRGSEASDAVTALKTVLGDREYNSRRGYYNFYVRQLMDMSGQQGMAEDYNPEYDDEAGMVENNLETLDRTVQGLDDLIDSGDNLPEWCQEKIAVAKSMLVAVWDYMYSEEASDEVDPEVDEMFEAMDQLAEQLAAKHQVSADTVWESFEALDDRILYETAAWRRKEGKSKTGGLNAKGVASYRRENPGSKLQTAVTTKPSKLKPGSKAAKRRKSFCARMSGVKGPMKKPNGKPTRKALALRKWNC